MTDGSLRKLVRSAIATPPGCPDRLTMGASLMLALTITLAACLASTPAGRKDSPSKAPPPPPAPKFDIANVVARDFDSFDVRLESARSVEPFFPYKIFTPPEGKSRYEHVGPVFAIITLRNRKLAGPDQAVVPVVGELVFIRQGEVPFDHASSIGNTWGVVLYFPREDFDDVLRVLEMRKSGTIVSYTACSMTSDDTAECWPVGKLVFLEKAPDGSPYNWPDKWWLP